MSAETSRTATPLTSDVVRDTILWRRKKLGLMVLVMATATWVAMEVYGFNFITLASWFALVAVASMFLWGITLRLLGKEEPKLSRLEISEQSVMRMANTARAWMEEYLRWMLRVGAESDWFTFAGVVLGLWALSKVGGYFDLLTILYLGIVVGMTVPAMYVRYDENIKQLGERVKAQWRRVCEVVDVKVMKRVRSKIHVTENRDEKTE